MKYVLIALIVVMCFSNSTYSQCSTPPQVSISGNMCVGSELRLNSTILPASITWSLAGNSILTKTAIFNTKGVTVAGGNGPGSNANQLNNPDRLFVDATGVMYIPDYGNNRIQKWLPGATEGETVAGGNGAGKAADQFDQPTSVFIDNQGNLYVTDQNNKRVQKWAPGATKGVTVANDLLDPTDLFLDWGGNMYVSDQWADVVKKYAPGSSKGVEVASGFNAVTGIFVTENGDLYACNTLDHRVDIFTAGGSRSTIDYFLNIPLDVTVDCNGNVFVVDYGSDRIMKYTPAGGPRNPTVVIGNGKGNAPDQLNNPIGIFLAENNNAMYVSDFNNHRVQKFSKTIDPLFMPTVPGIYTVTVTYDCCPAVTKTFEVYKGGIPEVIVTASATTICPGEEVSFAAQNVNAITNPSYQWTLNGAHIGSNAAQFRSVTLNNHDNVLCILTSPDACPDKPADTSNVIQIKIKDTLLPHLGGKVFICPGADTVLRVASIYRSYQWQDNSTGPEFHVDTPGKYYITVKDDCDRSLSDTVFVNNYKPDNRILPADTTICSYDSAVLSSIKPALSYLWSNGSTGDSYVVYQPGEYWLESRDLHSCMVRDSIYINTKTCPPRGVYMPNAFTPDNNGSNDVFKPTIYGTTKKYRFAVFNRYGQMVFNTTNPREGWNGSINGNLPNAGMYVWYCSYELHGQKPKTDKGTVVLVK
jgi:gliding motility-associated-like protein